MRAQLVRSEFQRELGLVQSVVERRPTIPILSYIRCEVRDGRVWFTGTDLDVSLKSECPADVVEPGVVCLPARKLFEIVRSLPDELPVVIEGTEERVQLVCGRSRFRLAGLPAENFPEIPVFPTDGVQVFSASTWRNGIERVIFATTMEEMRYTLSGVQVEWWADGVRMVATDGHRLALWETGEPPAERRSCLVPKRAFVELKRMIGESDVGFVADVNHAYFRTEGRELVSRLLTGQFPNYEMVIPKEVGVRAVVSAVEFREACRRVGILADERGRGVRLSFSSGKVVLTARSAEVDEEAQEEVECAYDGEPMEVMFNVEYLRDFFEVVDGDVEIGLKDEFNPALFRPLSGDGRYLYVVMPMRLM